MNPEDALERVAALREPNRRLVYERLSAAVEPATRKDLAERLDMSLSLVSFHLDRLVEADLVRVLPAQRTARRGRPARRYEATDTEVSVSLPPRRYDLVAEILALAEAEQQSGEAFRDGALRTAFDHGQQLGRDCVATAPGRRTSPMRQAMRLLGELGYEPRRTGRRVVLENCPFERLRSVNASLVCPVNQALAHGCLAGLGLEEQLTAQLEPGPDRCCVQITPAGAVSTTSKRAGRSADK